MKFFKLSMFFLVAAIVAGCATIVGGGNNQSISFDSSPQGASIFLGKVGKEGKVVDLVDTGLKTPAMLDVPRRNAVIILKKEGYKDTNVVMSKAVNGWFFGNIIIGGLIGMSVDLSTGAVNRYDPDNFFLELVAEE